MCHDIATSINGSGDVSAMRGGATLSEGNEGLDNLRGEPVSFEEAAIGAQQGDTSRLGLR